LVENRECPENCVNVRDTLKMGGKPLTKFDSKPSTLQQMSLASRNLIISLFCLILTLGTKGIGDLGDQNLWQIGDRKQLSGTNRQQISCRHLNALGSNPPSRAVMRKLKTASCG